MKKCCVFGSGGRALVFLFLFSFFFFSEIVKKVTFEGVFYFHLIRPGGEKEIVVKREHNLFRYILAI